MTSAAPAAAEAITADRAEVKHAVPTSGLDVLLGELGDHLPSHHFSGDGANRLPDPEHFVTTVYFDTPTRALHRAAVRDMASNVKLRAREYYDLHPSLAELASDLDEIVRYQPWLWFELKRREGDRTTKHRFRLRKSDVPAFFGQSAESTEAAADPELAHIARFCRSLPEPLAATVLVNYRRLSFQDAAGDLRVTVDLDVSFYAPPADLWTRARALTRETLGPLAGRERRVLVEVKTRGAIPPWLPRALERAGGGRVSFSKFVSGGLAVHADG